MTRFGYVLATLLAAEFFVVAFMGIAWLEPHPRFLWNASASAPIGLYRLQPDDHPAVGELVAIMPPPDTARLMARRHYLPEGVPMLKRIAALSGQRVCRHGMRVTIDGKRVANALIRGRLGRALPVWRGCRVVPAGTLFLINAPADSFDSRYFGPIAASGLIGRAQPILTRDTPQGPLVWRGLRGGQIASPRKEGATQMQIGCFHQTRDGFEGRITSLMIDAPVCLVPAHSAEAENAPQWRLLRGDSETGVEIGAGWNRTGERAGDYIALQFDDPQFAESVRANLLRSLQSDGQYILLWSRPNPRDRR